MEHKITLESFLSNIDFVKESIFNNIGKKIKVIEFRTLDEGLCDATYFICPKKEIDNRFEAFVSLLNHEVHFYEEWNKDETTQENIANILNNFIIPTINQFKFKTITAEQVKKEAEWITSSIKEKIINVEPTSFGYPSRWGVYVNNQRVDDVQQFIPVSSDINWAIGFELEWNSIEIFFETENEFVLFSWSTGA